jgi:hypothetical protein
MWRTDATSTWISKTETSLLAVQMTTYWYSGLMANLLLNCTAFRTKWWVNSNTMVMAIRLLAQPSMADFFSLDASLTSWSRCTIRNGVVSRLSSLKLQNQLRSQCVAQLKYLIKLFLGLKAVRSSWYVLTFSEIKFYPITYTRDICCKIKCKRY